ncbi:MAG: hypothetical protein HFF90_05300 [Oscillibacter sp.]|nr:hypothetical protein [Oscillibacter sp.]
MWERRVEWRGRVPAAGDIFCGSGGWDSDCRYFSGRCAAVFGGVPFDKLRLRLLPQVKGGSGVNIVVWKSPKMLRGILRKLFGVKA